MSDDEPDRLLRAIAALDQQILHLKERMRDIARKPSDAASDNAGDLVGEISRLADLKTELRERLSWARAAHPGLGH